MVGNTLICNLICSWQVYTMLLLWQYQFIQTFHLFMSTITLCLTINAFIFVFHLNMSSFQTSYGLRVNRVHCHCSVITQSFFLSFRSSFVPKPLRNLLGSLAQPSSIFSVYCFHPAPASPQRGAFCWLTLPYCSPPSHATGHNFRENCTSKWVGLVLYWFYLARLHKRNILLAVYHIIL